MSHDACNMAVINVCRAAAGIMSFLLFLAVSIGITAYDFYFYGVSAKRAQARLEVELREIPVYPGSSQCEYDASHKPGIASVSASYQTKVPIKEIANHYDTELQRLGWKLCREVRWDGAGPNVAPKTRYY